MLSGRRCATRGHWLRWFGVVPVLVGLTVAGNRPALGQHSRFATADSRSDYVHWIELRDAKGNPIDPTAPGSPPYSPRKTCGKCHDYDAIARGHHFNMLSSQGDSGRPGEPWIWTDLRTGTQLPLSYRGWPGTYRPDELGLSQWDVLLKFGHHLPGGGLGEPGDAAEADKPGVQEPAAESGAASGAGETASAPKAESDRKPGRWKLSGPLEIDCLICHSNDRSYNYKLRARQISQQNLAWAATVAAGLGDVTGSVKSLPDSFDPSQSAGEKTSGRRLPQVTYRQGRFVEGGEIFIDIVRQPSNNACYYCHTTHPAGPQSVPEWLHDEDVHVEAGLSCSDCHRNGLEHHTVRGFEGEQHPTGHSVETFSCRGCHLGEGSGPEAGGHFAAPRPQHKGLPPLHFEKLACTACHAGPWPGDQPQVVQTSLAHELGEPAHRKSDDPPQIVAPVFLKGADGRIAPYRLVWPAFWGLMEGDQIRPLNPETAYKELRRALRVRRDFRKELVRVRLSTEEKASVLGEDRAKVPEMKLTEQEKAKLQELVQKKRAEGFPEKLAAALKDLGKKHPDTTPVYVAGGKVYRLGADGKLEQFEHAAAEPYAWPLGHDVRPASQSLGAGGCTDCHSDGSALFYGTVTALGPAPDTTPKTAVMYELQGLDPDLLKVWNESFRGRPAFKWFAFIAVGLTAAIVIVFLLVGLNGLIRLLFRRSR